MLYTTTISSCITLKDFRPQRHENGIFEWSKIFSYASAGGHSNACKISLPGAIYIGQAWVRLLVSSNSEIVCHLAQQIKIHQKCRFRTKTKGICFDLLFDRPGCAECRPSHCKLLRTKPENLIWQEKGKIIATLSSFSLLQQQTF